MTHYVEYVLRPGPEFGVVWLREELMQKIHMALVKVSANDVGMSFPEVDEAKHCLGTRIRMHGNEERLQAFCEALQISRGLRDFIDIGLISPIPRYVQHRVVSRVHLPSNSQIRRSRKRAMLREGLSESEAKQRYKELRFEDAPSPPFIYLNSLSSEQRFRLCIEHGEIVDTAKHGIFSLYGLSSRDMPATVPWF